MSCTDRDLSAYSESINSEDHSNLCEVCQKIPWLDLTEHRTYGSDENHSHFRIGSLDRCSRKQFCPGCRLILSIVASTCSESDRTDKIQITLDSSLIYGWHKSDRGDGSDGRITRHINVRIEDSRKSLGAICRKFKPDTAPPMDFTNATIISEEDSWGGGRDLQKEANIGLIKDWLRFCRASHCECRLLIYDTVGDIKIRLIDTKDQRIIWATPKQDYVALSYVWGKRTKGLLTKDTVSMYSSFNALRSCNIPKTISDAMKFVALMGMRYLWVDSLCIIQDDNEDKMRQLPLMGFIYNQATLSIIASSSIDAHDGLPRLQSMEQSISQRTEIINGTPLITVQPELDQALSDSVWYTRGWTFQEAMLSRRTVIFTKAQIYWNCRNESWREDRIVESSVLKWPLNHHSFLGPLVVNRRANYCACICRTSIYCEQVQMFSKRSFGLESDIVWGFIGIMKSLEPRFPEGFIWGIPYERIDLALLWSEVCTCPHTHSRHARHTMNRRDDFYDISYPSWSWLSSDTEVSWSWLASTNGVPTKVECGNSILSAVTWHKPFRLGDEVSSELLKSIYPVVEYSDGMERQRLWSQEFSTFGMQAVDYGILHFTAQTAELTLHRSPDNEQGRANSANLVSGE